MSTPAQIKVNQANSQLSTGPKTQEGKAKVAHNAVRNALTGATVLLPADLYQQQLGNANQKWQPAVDGMSPRVISEAKIQALNGAAAHLFTD